MASQQIATQRFPAEGEEQPHRRLQTGAFEALLYVENAHMALHALAVEEGVAQPRFGLLQEGRAAVGDVVEYRVVDIPHGDAGRFELFAEEGVFVTVGGEGVAEPYALKHTSGYEAAESRKVGMGGAVTFLGRAFFAGPGIDIAQVAHGVGLGTAGNAEFDGASNHRVGTGGLHITRHKPVVAGHEVAVEK